LPRWSAPWEIFKRDLPITKKESKGRIILPYNYFIIGVTESPEEN